MGPKFFTPFHFGPEMFGKHANRELNRKKYKKKKEFKAWKKYVLSGRAKICLDLCVNNAQQIKLSVISIAYIMGRTQISLGFLFFLFAYCSFWVLLHCHRIWSPA